MALPKIEPLSSEFEVTKNDSNAVKVQIEKLGKAIFEKTNTNYKIIGYKLNNKITLL